MEGGGEQSGRSPVSVSSDQGGQQGRRIDDDPAGRITVHIDVEREGLRTRDRPGQRLELDG